MTSFALLNAPLTLYKKTAPPLKVPVHRLKGVRKIVLGSFGCEPSCEWCKNSPRFVPFPPPSLSPSYHSLLSIFVTYFTTFTQLTSNMGFFSDDSPEAQAAEQVRSGNNKSSWTHELIAGAAAFEAAKAYEQHVSANGQPASHQLAKELFAGFAGAEADKMFETHGLDFIDREKAKHQAAQVGAQSVASQY